MKKTVLFISILFLLSACSKNEGDVEQREFVPGEVIVGIKSGTDINFIFEFINQMGYTVDNISSMTYTSDLSSDSLQFVLDALNDKVYTNNGIDWFVTGYLHYQTKQITVFPNLFEMNDTTYQNDWLNSMTELKLHEKHHTALNSGVLLFNVPVGKELECMHQFENNGIVDWAELNYINEFEAFVD